ncbi:cytoplasmic aconitate hydratase [Spatholobus suberectus]|nr:cytoplasmic aconitate hydratase [Spatholobus suberectus]
MGAGCSHSVLKEGLEFPKKDRSPSAEVDFRQYFQQPFKGLAIPKEAQGKVAKFEFHGQLMELSMTILLQIKLLPS